MANAALRPDSVRANPNPVRTDSDGDTTPATTRRRALATIFATPAIAMIPPLLAGSCTKAEAAVPSRGISPALLLAMSTADKADELAWAACELEEQADDAAQREIDALPHATTHCTYINTAHEVKSLSTADKAEVATSRGLLAYELAHRIKANQPRYYATMEEHVALADARDAEAEKIRRRRGLDRIAVNATRLTEESSDARAAVFYVPALSITDLLAKMRHAKLHDWWHDLDWLHADVARLAGEA